MTRRSMRAALIGALLSVLLLPSLAAAHPLGNFTINHYAGIRIEPDRILLDIVIDHAEIPAFQARQELDTDGDGELSDAEIAAARATVCTDLAPSLELLMDERRLDLTLIARGLEFPPGVGGLATMRIVCGYMAAFDEPIKPGTTVGFADDSYPDRLGWREIVVEESGVTIEAVDGEVRSTSVSARLTEYPTSLLDRPIVDRSIIVAVSLGGPMLPPFEIVDAVPLVDAWPSPIGEPSTAPAVVPGGIGGEIPELFATADLTPFILALSLLVAAALGAGHALTPGHGKTLMAAYLVGVRGTPVHALGLGLSVSVSHTLGILLLALIVVGAQEALPPDLVVRIAPIVAAVSIVAIGAWMLATEVRRRKRVRESARTHAHAHEWGHDHEHHVEPGRDHQHAPDGHSHGGVSHRHVPVPGSTITWRSLFVLGLAGGLIPSTNALLILLGAVAAGRPAFGMILVIAFGLGMAAVMAGIGLLFVVARGRIDLLPSGSLLGRIREWMPAAAAAVVLGLGIWLTMQAVTGPLSL